MTKRENIIKILKRQGGDYIPFDLSFTPRLVEEFKKKQGEVDVADYYDFDFRDVYILPSKKKHDYSFYYRNRTLHPNVRFDSNGVAHEPGSFEHFTHIVSPLAGTPVTLKDINSYPLDDRDADYRYQGLEARVAEIHNKGYAVMGRPGHTFETAWAIRGMEEMLMDFYTNSEAMHRLCERIHQMNMVMTSRFAKAGVDIMAFGDDVGTQTGMMFSPAVWRDFFKTRLKKQIAEAKRINPDILTWYHSDGDISEIIPELIEIGLDILNPVQPECLDPVEIKKQYGDKLSFWGTIGTQTVMPFGSPEDVRETVKRMSENVGYNGGLVLAPTHILEPEVSWENINAYVDAVREYGRI